VAGLVIGAYSGGPVVSEPDTANTLHSHWRPIGQSNCHLVCFARASAHSRNKLRTATSKTRRSTSKDLSVSGQVFPALSVMPAKLTGNPFHTGWLLTNTNKRCCAVELNEMSCGVGMRSSCYTISCLLPGVLQALYWDRDCNVRDVAVQYAVVRHECERVAARISRGRRVGVVRTTTGRELAVDGWSHDPIS